MKRKMLSLLLVLLFTLSLVPFAAAESGEAYVIYCVNPSCPGYCYVYDEPSSMSGRNLGRMDNGYAVTMYRRTNSGRSGWFYISGYNTKGKYIYGYVHYYSAVPESEYNGPIYYGPGSETAGDEYPLDMIIECYSDKCPGYCYVYDQPDDMTGRNLGRMDNGTNVTAYKYVNGTRSGWYYISGYNTKGKHIYGYIHYYSAVEGGTGDPGEQGYHEDNNIVTDFPADMVIDCINPACPGYCYVYDQPSDMTGRNLGRMNNGTRVTGYSYKSTSKGGWYYISGYNTKGKFIYGYVHYYSASEA